MTNKQVSFAYPNYSQEYYSYMFNSIIKKLLCNNDTIYYYGPNYASRHLASSAIVSINEARDKLNIKKQQKLILWLQDCPYSKYEKLIKKKNILKKGDVILFAAPNHFGFNWQKLIDKGIKIDYLFYGYNEAFDLGIDFIKNKFKKENLKNILKIYTSNFANIVSEQGIVEEFKMLEEKCSNPIIVLHGFYENSFEELDKSSSIQLKISSFKNDEETFLSLLRPKRLFHILKSIILYLVNANFLIRKFEKDNYTKFRKIYRIFKGSLSNKIYLENVLKTFRNKNIINSYSRFIEREQILLSIKSFGQQIGKKNTLLIGDGLTASPMGSGHARLGSQNYTNLMAILLHTHCVIGNNTHGLGLHPRNLDAFITGNIVLHHLSPDSYGLGVLENHFTSKEFLAWENNYQLTLLIEKIIENPTMLQDIAINAYKKVKGNHGWDKVADKLNFYLNL